MTAISLSISSLRDGGLLYAGWFDAYLFETLFSCGGENDLEQYVPPVALFGGKRNELDILRQGQRLADAGQVRLDLALFQLVELVRYDDERLGSVPLSAMAPAKCAGAEQNGWSMG